MIGWEGEMERQEKDREGARRVGHCTEVWSENGAQEKVGVGWEEGPESLLSLGVCPESSIGLYPASLQS